MRKYFLLLVCLFSGCALETNDPTYPEGEDLEVRDVAVTEQTLLPIGCGAIQNIPATRCYAFDNQDDGRVVWGYCPSGVFAGGPGIMADFKRTWSGSGRIYVSNSWNGCVRVRKIVAFQECRNSINGSYASPITRDITPRPPGYWYARNEGESFSALDCGAGLDNAGLTIEATYDGYTSYNR